ncbi:flavodoxin [Amorphus sp. MBR-141]
MTGSGKITRRSVLISASAMPLAGIGSLAGAAEARSQYGRSDTLVAFFSRSGNTRLVARKIALARKADLFEIRPADTYPEDYEETVAQATREREAGYEPPLAERAPDLGTYDTVFLGFPIWGMTAPPVIRSFLSAHDLAGKTLVPFVVHGGYGIGSSLQVVADHVPDANLVEGFSMEGEQEKRVVERVTEWLGEIEPAG